MSNSSRAAREESEETEDSLKAAAGTEKKKRKKKKKDGAKQPKNPYEYHRELTDSEKMGIDAMREKLKGSEYEYAGEDVGQLLRFLRARDFDVNKSHPMLIEALEFFKTYQPEKITPSDLGDEIRTAKYLCLGKDKSGRPLLGYRSGRHVPGRVPIEQSVKCAHWIIQRAFANMGAGVERFILVFDREGFVRKNFDLAFLKELANSFEKYYPERVEKIFVRNVDWVFWIMYKIAKPFLPSATADKIVLLGKDPAKDLLEHVSQDQLWQRYGGTWKMPEDLKQILGITDGDEDGSTPVQMYKANLEQEDADSDEEPQEDAIC